MSTYWPREKLERFIDEYRSRPILWDIKQKGYHNKILREQAYSEIGEMLNETKDGITKKINNLRSQYLSEIKKIIRSKSNAGDTDNVYVSRWWAFNRLHFLKESPNLNESIEHGGQSQPTSTYIIRLNNEVSKQDSEQELAELEEIYPENSPSPVAEVFKPPSPKRKRKKLNPANLTSIVASALDSSQKDVYDSYGKYIADEIRSITDVQQQQLLKLKIQHLIYYAHKGWLQESENI